MNRFFTNKPINNVITMPIDDHALKVLRMKKGDKIIACDGKGWDYNCKILTINHQNIELLVESKKESIAETSVKIHLYISLSKGDKMDLVIQKATELGITSITPVISKRCISKPKTSKISRYNKIAESASKQSGRGTIPKVKDFKDFKDAIKEQADLKIILYENEKNQSLKSTLNAKLFNEISIFIGPEGGFEKEEIDLAISQNTISTSIGKRILRCETAPIACISAIMYHLDEF